MTVGELIEKLKEFSEDMRVVDWNFDPIVEVNAGTWSYQNFPYDKPDEHVVRIL